MVTVEITTLCLEVDTLVVTRTWYPHGRNVVPRDVGMLSRKLVRK